MVDVIQAPMPSLPVAAAKVFAFAGCEGNGGFHEVDKSRNEPSYCYDENRTWAENMSYGLPARCRTLPPSVRCWAPEDKWCNFLNHKLASPLGVAAGPLLSSKWVVLAASRGYDCLTYKTIRSHYHAGHGLPNIVYLQVDQQLSASGPACEQPLFAQVRPPGTPSDPEPQHSKPSAPDEAHKGAPYTKAANGDVSNGIDSGICGGRGAYDRHHTMLAITNSFGMPSLGPEQLAEDVPAAATALRPGQMMVVSITGTPGRPGLSFQEDLVLAAKTALRGGATALEVNLSCPNVGASHVALYQDAPAVAALVTGLVEEIGREVPLVIKVGSFPDIEDMRRVLQAAERSGISAVAGINGLSRRVELPDGGGPALGPDRPTSGVCGDPIRKAGLEFITQARQISTADHLELELVGVGGVTEAHHVMEYLKAGANVVQTATGFMWKPNLGMDFQRLWEAAGYSVPGADGRGGRG